MIAERIVAALAAAKVRGVRPGDAANAHTAGTGGGRSVGVGVPR
jgi:hypothetical protein